jgi:hypothetical protein
LFGDSQRLKIAFGEIGNFDGEAERGEFFREEARLAGGWTGSKTVEIKDTQALGQYLYLNDTS